jgi:hypothetical protein
MAEKRSGSDAPHAPFGKAPADSEQLPSHAPAAWPSTNLSNPNLMKYRDNSDNCRIWNGTGRRHDQRRGLSLTATIGRIRSKLRRCTRHWVPV